MCGKIILAVYSAKLRSSGWILEEVWRRMLYSAKLRSSGWILEEVWRRMLFGLCSTIR